MTNTENAPETQKLSPAVLEQVTLAGIESTPAFSKVLQEIGTKLATVDKYLTQLESDKTPPQPTFTQKVHQKLRELLLRQKHPPRLPGAYTRADLPYYVAHTFFEAGGQFEKLILRTFGQSPVELSIDLPFRDDLNKIKARLEAIFNMSPNPENRGEPTLLHVTVAFFWNQALERYNGDVIHGILNSFTGEKKGTWRQFTPVDYVLFKLAVMGIKSEGQRVTAAEVQQALLEYKSFLLTDERVVPTVTEVFADINELLEANNRKQISFSTDAIFFVTWEQFLEHTNKKPGNRAAYDNWTDIVLVPVHRGSESPTDSQLGIPNLSAVTKEQVYELVMHEELHRVRVATVLGSRDTFALEEGLISLLTKRLQVGRGYETETMKRTYPFSTALMEALVGDISSEQLLVLDNQGLINHLNQKYVGAVPNENEPFYYLTHDVLHYFEIERQIAEREIDTTDELEAHFKLLEDRWGVKPEAVAKIIEKWQKFLKES